MYLSAATPEYVTRQDYQAPVYRNILDILKSVEHMNGQVFNSAVGDALKVAVFPAFAGYAINKTGVQSRLSGLYLIATELAGMLPASAKAMLASMESNPGKPNAQHMAIRNRFRRGALDPARRRDIVSNLQDEIETLVREMNRVRLPLPTDLRNWARRLEDLAYALVPAPFQPPRPFQAPPARSTATGMEAYELARQARQMRGWLPLMRLALHKEIAKANLRGKIGAIDLELTPSMRAIDAAKSLATVSAIEKREALRIAAAYERKKSGQELVRDRFSASAPIDIRAPASLTQRLTADGKTAPERDTLTSAAGKGAISAAVFLGAMYWLFFRG